MTLQSSGALSLSQIQTEFGGANPIGMSEYYAGGANVPGGTSGVNGAVPTSGTISMSKFYGTSDVPAVSFSPSGGASAGAPQSLSDFGQLNASVTITCSQSATWTWTKSGTGGSASVSSGGSATSITFSNSTITFGGFREAVYTVSATAGGITRYWSVTVSVEDNS